MAFADKKGDAKRKNPKKCRFLQGGTQSLNSCHSLDYARDNESIIYFNDLCKPIEIYIYARKKHPFTSYPAAKHPKHSKFAITDMREKPVDFLLSNTGVDFSSYNDFVNFRLLCERFRSWSVYNSLFTLTLFKELSVLKLDK